MQWSTERVPAPRLVVCHLGGGCSVSAVRDGRSVDTSMGFTPLEGVPMAARSGSVDPGILLFLLREQFLTLDELDHQLEHESGLTALGGLEDPLGFGVYTHRIAAAVAAMASALGGLDALVFTAGVGENVPVSTRGHLPSARLPRDQVDERRTRGGARRRDQRRRLGGPRRRRRRARGDRRRPSGASAPLGEFVKLDYSFLVQMTVSEASLTVFLFVAGVVMLACAVVSALRGWPRQSRSGWEGCT